MQLTPQTLRPASRPPQVSPVHLELIANAVRAASSHNTQPWLFRSHSSALEILPDYARRCPQVDPDDHHLFASLGCAAENLVLAAAALGLHADVRFQDRTEKLRVELSKMPPSDTPEYRAIPLRQCSRTLYDGKPLTLDELHALERVATGQGVSPLVLTSVDAKETVIEYVARGNEAQFSDPAWSAELKHWIRFNRREAVRRGDGLYGRALGIPNVPRWLGRVLMPVATSASSQNDKDAHHIRSSAAVLVLFSEVDDRAHWIEAGRCAERAALWAASLGINSAFTNQPVEVAPLRAQFAAAMGFTGRRPELILRLGRGPTAPRSYRRPLHEVIVLDAPTAEHRPLT